MSPSPEQAKRRAAAKAKGVCCACSKRPPIKPGGYYCYECAERQAKKCKQYYAKKKEKP